MPRRRVPSTVVLLAWRAAGFVVPPTRPPSAVVVPRRIPSSPTPNDDPTHKKIDEQPRTTSFASFLSEVSRLLPAEQWARLGILSCAAVYGTNFAVVKSLDAELAPSLSASLRFGLAATAAAPLWWRSSIRKEAAANEADVASFTRGAAEVGAVNAIGYLAQAVGLESVPASVSAFVCSLAVVVVPCLDAVFLGRRQSRATWGGALVAALGVAVLALGSVSSTSSSAGASVLPAPSALGLVATAAQPVCFAWGFWRTERLVRAVAGSSSSSSSSRSRRRQHRAEKDTTEDEEDLAVGASLACAAAQLAAVKAASDVWLVCDLVDGRLADAPASLRVAQRPQFLSHDHHDLPFLLHRLAVLAAKPDLVGAILWTGICTTFATILVETVALSKISAKESSLLFTTEPLFGTAFAAATLHESLGPETAVGAALVLGACTLSALSGGGGGPGTGTGTTTLDL